MAITVEEKTVRKVTIREPGRWWAIFTFDEEHGDIHIQSDFGNWGYVWSRSGRGSEKLSDFLKHAGVDYITNKLCMDKPESRNYFFAEETKREMKKEILKARRHRSERTYEHISKEEARDAWLTVEEADTTTAMQFVDDIGCDAVKKIWGEEFWYDPPIVTGYEPHLVNFMKNIWPLFIKHLHGEQVSGQEAG